MPLPFIDTFKSLGFFNRLIFILLITYLALRQEKIDNKIIFILIFYPSIILYTNIPLRDTFILISIILVVIFTIEKKYIRTFIIITFLYFLRPVNGLIMLLISISYFLVIRIEDKFFKIIMFMLFGTSLLLLNFLFFDQILERINDYKTARAAEDLIDSSRLLYASNLFELIFSIINNIPKFFLFPLPWDAANIFMLIQSIENILILIFVIYLFFSCRKIGFSKNFFWITSLIFIGGLFGYVQSNIGGLSRYKFVFFAMYIVAILYEKQLYDVKRNINKI